MGKAKQRSFFRQNRDNKFQYVTRENALAEVVANIEDKNKVIDMITLFDFTAEEILEAGAAYEDVLAFGGILR